MARSAKILYFLFSKWECLKKRHRAANKERKRQRLEHSDTDECVILPPDKHIQGLVEVGNGSKDDDERVQVDDGQVDDGQENYGQEDNGQENYGMTEEKHENFEKEIKRLEAENEQLRQALKKEDPEKVRNMPWREKLLLWLGRTLPELRKQRLKEYQQLRSFDQLVAFYANYTFK